MSEPKIRSVAETTGKTRVQSYQPVWMAHWMRPSSNAASERRNHSACGNVELDRISRGDDSSDGSEASRPVQEARVIETKNFEIVSSKNLENERTCESLMRHGQDTDNKQAQKQVFGHSLDRGKAIDWKSEARFPTGIAAVNEASLGGCKSLDEGTSKNHPEWMKTHASAKDRTFNETRPFHETFAGSSKYIGPYCNLDKNECDKGKAAVSPLLCRPSVVSDNQLPNATTSMLNQEEYYKHRQTADLICERKTDSHAESDTSMGACFGEFNTPLLFDVPSTSGHHLPTFGRDWFQKMQKHSGITLLPSQWATSEEAETKKSCYNCYSVQKLPNCVHDTKTVRICTTVDSVEAMPGGLPRFSQTTHSLLITEKTDVNVSKQNDVLRTMRLITEMDRSTSNDNHSPSPFSGQGNRGVKLQPLSSSSNSEGKRNVGNVKTSKVTIRNESSAETDTMEMDIFKEENSNSGANDAPSTKGFTIDSNLSPWIDAASPREVGRHYMNTGVPDINVELPTLPAVASSAENVCPSSSKTQSLEMDVLVAHAEHQHPKLKSNPYLGDSSEVDPTMRWVKRLKLRSSDSSSQGTRSSNLENSPPDKMRKFFRRIIESGIANSEPTARNYDAIETIPPHEDLSKNDEDFIADPAKKDRELLLSHAWIKRWLRNGSSLTKKKPEVAVVVCEPQKSKLALDDFQKKQFPSIAAMALMGKAMNGFQSCELQKRDSITVWNTKAF